MPRLRRRITIERKCSVLAWMTERNATEIETAREFGVCQSMVSRWKKQEDILIASSTGRTGMLRHLHPGRPAKSVDLDEHLFHFLLDERALGHAVSNISLKQKALQLAAQMGENMANFQASDGFIRKWKSRFSIVRRRRTNLAHNFPHELQNKMREFRQNIRDARLACAIDSENIVNMDQTMCWFDMPSAYTNETRGANNVRLKTTGCTKKGFTVALACSATGHKLPAMVIFKERNGVLGPVVVANIVLPENVLLAASESGWMTQHLIHQWLTTVYGVDEHAANPRRLLVLDKYKGHTTEETQDIVSNVCNAELVYVEAGCTGYQQPLDISVNKQFKSSMRSSWSAWMGGPHDLTPAGNIRPPRRQDILDWVGAAWAAVDHNSIVTAFLLAGISNAMDGTEEDRLGVDVPIMPPQHGEINEFALNPDENHIEDDGLVDIADMEPFNE